MTQYLIKMRMPPTKTMNKTKPTNFLKTPNNHELRIMIRPNDTAIKYGLFVERTLHDMIITIVVNAVIQRHYYGDKVKRIPSVPLPFGRATYHGGDRGSDVGLVGCEKECARVYIVVQM